MRNELLYSKLNEDQALDLLYAINDSFKEYVTSGEMIFNDDSIEGQIKGVKWSLKLTAIK